MLDELKSLNNQNIKEIYDIKKCTIEWRLKDINQRIENLEKIVHRKEVENILSSIQSKQPIPEKLFIEKLQNR